LRDPWRPRYFRANLALAYAKALNTRRCYEEALEALLVGGAEEVVDPALYHFLSAHLDHALMLPRQARAEIEALLGIEDTPERYRQLALEMEADMETWQDR